MEVTAEASANTASTRVPRTRRGWLIATVLLAAVLSCGYFLRSRNQDAQWLAGHWTLSEVYNEESREERELTFEPHGRVSGISRLILTGKTPSTQIRKFVGQWTVRDGLLSIRIDRPVLRSLSHAGHQAQVAVENAVTGSKSKLADPDYSQGRLVQFSQDRFTVTWIDPVDSDKVGPPHVWTRAE